MPKLGTILLNDNDMLRKGRSWTTVALCALLLHLWPLALAKSAAAPKKSSPIDAAALNQSRWSRYEKPRGEANPLKGLSKQLRHDPSALANRARCGQIDLATTKLKGKIYYNNATDHYSYEPDACVLRRLDAQQALSCLAKQGPIVFLGDSVTRYQVSPAACTAFEGCMHTVQLLTQLVRVNRTQSRWAVAGGGCCCRRVKHGDATCRTTRATWHTRRHAPGAHGALG